MFNISLVDATSPPVGLSESDDVPNSNLPLYFSCPSCDFMALTLHPPSHLHWNLLNVGTRKQIKSPAANDGNLEC